jgi:hypothetical protein
LKLLFDNNISPRVARAIQALVVADGDSACALRDKYDPSTPDVEWIRGLASEGGWYVVSGDHRITKNKIEREAWLQTELVGFFLEPSLARLDPLQQTARLLFWLPSLRKQSTLIRGPALFALPLKHTSRLRQL